MNIEIFSIDGENIKTLLNKSMPAGNHQLEWDATGFASGIYYYRIKAGEFQDVKKMILLR